MAILSGNPTSYMEWVFKRLLSVDLLAYWPPFPQKIKLPIGEGEKVAYTDAVCAWAGIHRQQNGTGVAAKQTQSVSNQPKKNR